jgi:hypothetical protein
LKTKWIAVFTIALVAADILQVAYAAPEDGSSRIDATPVTQLEKTEVRGQAITVARAPQSNYIEFGAGSHDHSLSSKTREEVRAEASERTKPADRAYFNY